MVHRGGAHSASQRECPQKPLRHPPTHHFRRTPSKLFDEMAGTLQAGTALEIERVVLFVGAIRCSERTSNLPPNGMPENRGLPGSVPTRHSTQVGRKTTRQRTQLPKRPFTRSRGHRQNNARDWPNAPRQGDGESRSLGVLAEGEELGSNILHVDDRNTAHLSACWRGSLLQTGSARTRTCRLCRG
jgi:hypothetical protein